MSFRRIYYYLLESFDLPCVLAVSVWLRVESTEMFVTNTSLISFSCTFRVTWLTILSQMCSLSRCALALERGEEGRKIARKHFHKPDMLGDFEKQHAHMHRCNRNQAVCIYARAHTLFITKIFLFFSLFTFTEKKKPHRNYTFLSSLSMTDMSYKVCAITACRIECRLS